MAEIADCVSHYGHGLSLSLSLSSNIHDCLLFDEVQASFLLRVGKRNADVLFTLRGDPLSAVFRLNATRMLRTKLFAKEKLAVRIFKSNKIPFAIHRREESGNNIICASSRNILHRGGDRPARENERMRETEGKNDFFVSHSARALFFARLVGVISFTFDPYRQCPSSSSAPRRQLHPFQISRRT